MDESSGGGGLGGKAIKGNSSFVAMGLHKDLLSGLNRMGYKGVDYLSLIGWFVVC